MSSRGLELLGWVLEHQGDLKKASEPNLGTGSSTEEGQDGAYELPSSSDTREDSVASSGIPSTLAGRHSELSAEAPALVPSSVGGAGDPFGYQLSHPSPLQNKLVTPSTQPPPTPALTREQLHFGDKDNEATTAPGPHATIACVAPQLAFLPSSSSTGYTLMGLPIVTHAETLLYSPIAYSSFSADHDKDIPEFTPPPRYYIPYLQLGYLELTDDLIRCICPFDLSGDRDGCPHDEVHEWNWIEARWGTAGGGCGMLRLCEALQWTPPPPPPAFVFPALVTHPDLTYRTSGHHSRCQITSRASHTTASSQDDPSYRLYTGRPMTSTLRAPPPRERLPPLSLLPTDHPHHALHCSHLHTIPRSCTSLSRRHPCLAVSQGRLCEHGHDLASARVYSEKVVLPQHRREYLAKRVRPGTVFLDRKGRWSWQRGQVIWRVGEMVDVDIAEAIDDCS